MVSMKDIAARCGVTVATVSKALSDKADIGEEMKKRIRKAAEEMGYFPNAAARALKTNKSYCLGVLFVDGKSSGLTHSFFSGLLDRFKITAESKGYDVSFVNNFVGRKAMSYREHCMYRRVDGVIIACVDFFAHDVVELAYSEIPIVSIDHVYTGKAAVLSDNDTGIRELVSYIHSMGHRDIAFIHGEHSRVTERRVRVFREQCAALGIPVREELVVQGLYNDYDTAMTMTRHLMALEKRPTCIIYPDDQSCIGGITELRRMGLEVPRDISVAGYDGTKFASVHSPKLTTIWQDSGTMGTIAAERLIAIVESGKPPESESITVPSKLIRGESVARLEVR